jgi:hypothetical protein
MSATLDREAILGIGIDDMAQIFARAKVEMLLQHLKACGDERSRKRRWAASDMGFEWEDELVRRDTENRDYLNVW